MLSDFWDSLKFHPGLVESGLTGLPKLEIGKFYTVPVSSHRTNNSHQALGSGWKVWECSSEPNYHSEWAVSYLMLTIGPHDGVVIETFQYGWFGKGDNIILELPAAQQEIYKTLKASVSKFTHIHLPSDHQLKEYRNAIQSKPGGSS